jgi:hypothetical protein
MLNSLFVPSAPVVPLEQLALIPPSWVHSVGEVPGRLRPQYFRDLVAGRTLRLDWSTEVR